MINKHGHFIVIALVYTLVYFHRNSMAVLSLPIEAEFIFGAAKIGLLGAAFLYTYSIMQFAAGLLTELFNPVRLIIASLVISSLGVILFSLGNSFITLFLGRFMLGIGTGLVFVPALKFLSIKYVTGEFATKSGLLITFGNFGAILATFPLALLAEIISWRTVILVIVFFNIILLLSLKGQYKNAALDPLEKQAISLRNILKPIRSININLIAFWLFTFCATKLTFIALWAGPFMKDIYQFSQTYIGIVLFASAVGMMIGSPVSGYISDRTSPRTALIGGSCLFSCWWGIIAIFPYPIPEWAAVISFFLMGLIGGCFIVAFSWAKELCRDLPWGISMGYINFVGFVGTAIMMPFSGIIIDHLEDSMLVFPMINGYRVNFIIFFMLMVASTALLYFFVKENNRNCID